MFTKISSFLLIVELNMFTIIIFFIICECLKRCNMVKILNRFVYPQYLISGIQIHQSSYDLMTLRITLEFDRDPRNKQVHI